MEAECIATIVVDKVLGLLTNETELLLGVVDPVFVEVLQIKLKKIRPLIENVDVRDDEIHEWLEEVAGIMQRLEVVIDTVLLHRVRQQRQKFVVGTYLRRMAQRQHRNQHVLLSGDSIAFEIQDIVAKLRKIEKRVEIQIHVYRFSLQRCLESSTNLESLEYEVVGIDSEKEQLLSVLVGEPSTRLVISLVGSGGVGKTALARVVYGNKVMKRDFDCCAWIRVSKSYDLKMLLMSLEVQICSGSGDSIGMETGTMELHELSCRLSQYLGTKRYVIVFDDVSQTDFWEHINNVFPNNAKGSRIIITTRRNAIADTCGDIIQNVPFSEKRAWELFCKHAFGFDFEGDCPPELEELSLEFIRRCHDLPLVIKALAGFLSTKEKVVSEWRRLLDNFSEEFEKNCDLHRVVSTAFDQSYDDLPSHIRLCFLYFGVFPKDYMISDLKLVKLWIAEGFVKEVIGKTLEQVAETYLNELIDRKLVQVSYINYNGKERMCGINHFMHDIILSKARRIKIRQVLDKKFCVYSQIRILSIYGDIQFELIENYCKVCMVPKPKLLKLRITKGFVKGEKGESLELVEATDYLQDLINMYMDYYYGDERMYRNDLFGHNSISSMAEEFKTISFLNKKSFRRKGKTLEPFKATDLYSYLSDLISIYTDYYVDERMYRNDLSGNNSISSMAEEVKTIPFLNKKSSRRKRRHSFIYGAAKNILETIGHSQVRSVFLFSVNKLVSKSFLVNLFEKFMLLELLDFENAQLVYLPNEVGNLFYLKYLGLRNTKVKKLPKSVGLLLNLQTLDVRNTLIHELPIQISKLQKLRHLLASTQNSKSFDVDSIYGVRVKEGIGCLENLQTLLIVDAHRSGFDAMEELEKLRQLRCLSISKLTMDMVNTLFASIKKMNHLESLSLYSASNSEVFDLESILSSQNPPSPLRHLTLKCRLEKLPDWILQLPNLCILSLSFSRLVVDPLKVLNCLPNLESLWLHQAYIGEQLRIEEGYFQKLKELVLTELYDVRAMRIEEGALPLLEELRIGPSPDDWSSDIQHLRNLKVLEYYDMPGKFVLCLQPESGSDYWKVKHVPSVHFWFRVEGRSYMLYKLGEPELLDHLQGTASNIDDAAHREVRLSFYYSDSEDDSSLTCNDVNQLSFSSGKISFFSDDIED